MSIVEYFPEHSGSRCGYCRGKNGSYSHGMWGHVLTCPDYQSLIDRGWRRSGRYCYKPTMDETCCPQYTIKCDVTKFTLTKSQKKILKKFRNFVINGETPTATNPSSSSSTSTIVEIGNNSDDSDQEITDEEDEEDENGMDVDSVNQNKAESLEGKLKFDSTTKKIESSAAAKNSSSSSSSATETDNGTPSKSTADPKALLSAPSKGATPKAGIGADPTKPRARKKKEIRKEKALAKLMAGVSGAAEQENPVEDDQKFVKPQQKQISSKSKKNNEPKTIEDLTSLEFPPHAKHKFEIRLVNAQTSDATFKDSYMDSYNIYKKYQMAIHKDPPSKCTVGQYKRFLCDASLSQKTNNSGVNETYKHGAFHQQYIMDGKIIAVGVIDILPSCISSVYLYYDPDYAFLSPGTLTSLFEIGFTRKLQKEHFPNLTNYYMGYYIHSCSKMRYKAKYSPSWILCPVTYQWVPVQDALPLLDKSKFATLSQDTSKQTADTSPAVPVLFAALQDASGQNNVAANNGIVLDDVLILHENQAMPFKMYRNVSSVNEFEKNEVMEYAKLVGKDLSNRILLYRG